VKYVVPIVIVSKRLNGRGVGAVYNQPGEQLKAIKWWGYISLLILVLIVVKLIFAYLSLITYAAKKQMRYLICSLRVVDGPASRPR